RQQVLELREFDLSLAFAALGVLAEDVEDDRGAIDHFHLDDVLECAPLARRQLAVGDDGVSTGRCDEVLELLRLPASEIRGRVWLRTPLQYAVQNDSTGCFGEGCEFTKRIL